MKKEHLVLSNHSFILVGFMFTSGNRQCIFLWVQKRFVSPVYIIGSRRLEAFFRSLIYKKIKSGANNRSLKNSTLIVPNWCLLLGLTQYIVSSLKESFYPIVVITSYTSLPFFIQSWLLPLTPLIPCYLFLSNYVLSLLYLIAS